MDSFNYNSLKTIMKNQCALLLALVGLASCFSINVAQAGIDDLTEWTLVEDPADPGMSAVATSSAATLTATGSVPMLTDIGYGSVNGVDVASSTEGHYFSTAEDFCVSIDFDFNELSTATGNGGFGFGIGEDVDGQNIAGVAAAIQDGAIIGYSATSRTSNVNSLPVPIGGIGIAEGTMIVEYQSVTGTIVTNMEYNSGATTIGTSLIGIQNGWADEPLLVSFFLRSDGTLGSPLTSGTVETVFSNFQVLCGTAVAIPEPTSLVLLLLGIVPATRRRQ